MKLKSPELELIRKRFKNVKKIIAVSGAKGGVGKSTVSSLLSLKLSEKNVVGLFDLDFFNPSCHVILGIKPTFKEEKGIVPSKYFGIKFFSIVSLTQKPLALRGEDLTRALFELFKTIRWGHLDYLIIDCPPGLSNVFLDLLRLRLNISFLLVSTPSLLSFSSLLRQIELLQKREAKIIGIIWNMVRKDEEIACYRKKININSIIIHFDPEFDRKIGNVSSIKSSKLYQEIGKIEDFLN